MQKILLSCLFIILILTSNLLLAQEKVKPFKWLRTGFVYGYASQNKYFVQDTDYHYETNSFKWSNHFNLSRKRKHAWELLIEPSYYFSRNESFNPWQKYYTSIDNAEEMRNILMPFKLMNEYALNLGITYRRYVSKNASVYTYLNVGPMYIDTDTDRLKKGFAFSDILAVGFNYRMKDFSLDGKTFFRHVSNANFQWPNFGLNAFGFEIGFYYELPL